jgi:hypothetical protein
MPRCDWANNHLSFRTSSRPRTTARTSSLGFGGSTANRVLQSPAHPRSEISHMLRREISDRRCDGGPISPRTASHQRCMLLQNACRELRESLPHPVASGRVAGIGTHLTSQATQKGQFSSRVDIAADSSFDSSPFAAVLYCRTRHNHRRTPRAKNVPPVLHLGRLEALVPSPLFCIRSLGRVSFTFTLSPSFPPPLSHHSRPILCCHSSL